MGSGLTRRELAIELGLSYRSIHRTLRALDRRPAWQKRSAEAEARRIAAVRFAGAARRTATQTAILALDDAGHRRAEIAAELDLSPKYVAAVLCAAGHKIRPARREDDYRQPRPVQHQLPL